MSDGSLYWKTTRAESDASRDVAAAQTAQALESLGFRNLSGGHAERPSRLIALPAIHAWTVAISGNGKGGSVVEVRHGLRATAATWWCLAAAIALMVALIVAGPFTDLGAAAVLGLLGIAVIDLKLTQMRLEGAFGRAIAAWAGATVTTSVSEVA